MSDSYFVRVRGRTLGPYDLDTMQQMVKRAQIGRAHEVSLDGSSWTSASTYREIFERPQRQPQVGLTTPAEETKYDPEVRREPPPAADGGQLPDSNAVPRLLWHYTVGGQQQPTPTDQQSLIALIASGRVGPDDSVWNETMSTWVNVAFVPELAAFALPLNSQQTQQASLPYIAAAEATGGRNAATYQAFIGKKTAAGVVALFLGNLGIHKFMLGLTTGGLTMLCLFFLILPIPVLTVISLVEGILYLTKTDEQFYQEYALQRKQWF